MGTYCNAVWHCRYFWLSLVQMDLRNLAIAARSLAWAGPARLFPLCMTAIFTAVFCRLFQHDPYYFAPYVLIGLSCWTYFLQTAMNGCLCFLTAEQYLRQHPVPLAIYPIRILRVPVSTSCSTAVATNVLVLLAMRNGSSARRGRPVRRSALPRATM